MRTLQWSRARCLIACALAVALLSVVAKIRPAQAGGVVTDCSSDAQFSSLLASGGTISFNCGPALIHLSSTQTINANTTIDGGGTITLSGDDARRLFVVSSGVTLTLNSITLSNGYAAGEDGGAIVNGNPDGGGTLIITNSRLLNNRATLSGGAIVSYGPLTITNSLLDGNTALNGGAVYPRWAGARTRIVNSVLRNNAATDTTDGWGGALLAWDGAPVTIEGSDIYSNTARFGGGIYNYANSALTLRGNTRLRNNVITRNGGGLYNAGTATLTNVTLSGNSANHGGGIENFNGTATLTDVTLSGNSAFQGGGIENFNGTASLANVTLSGNLAGEWGGGIYNYSGTTSLINVTLSGNTAGIHGGGISHNLGSVLVNNTIVANSPSGGNCSGAIINIGFNLASDTSCGFNYVPNVMLGPLADNGGPTLTHMPQPGSPAIDFVALGCPPPSTDQRGAKRPAGAACDAGAVEYGAAVAVVYLPLVRK